MKTKNVWETYSAAQLKALETFADGYRSFLDNGKTERECTDQIVARIEDAGYIPLSEAAAKKSKLRPGDKVYAVNMAKSVICFCLGKDDLADGMNILGAHIDSPRMDVKQNPLYQDGDFVYLDTHYYGGIKTYQWVTIPLALHGVVVKKDGTTAVINIGEEEDDPVFFVSDLLIHLAAEQMDKKAAKVIEGEALDIIIGNKPIHLTAAQKKAEAKKAEEAKKNGEEPDENAKKDPLPFRRVPLRSQPRGSLPLQYHIVLLRSAGSPW